MIISDLNYLNVISQADSIEGGTGGYYEKDKFNSNIYSDTDISGNTALAFSDALALGDDSFTKTATNTSVKSDVGSTSSSLSVSAVA